MSLHGTFHHFGRDAWKSAWLAHDSLLVPIYSTITRKTDLRTARISFH